MLYIFLFALLSFAVQEAQGTDGQITLSEKKPVDDLAVGAKEPSFMESSSSNSASRAGVMPCLIPGAAYPQITRKIVNERGEIVKTEVVSENHLLAYLYREEQEEMFMNARNKNLAVPFLIPGAPYPQITRKIINEHGEAVRVDVVSDDDLLAHLYREEQEERLMNASSIFGEDSEEYFSSDEQYTESDESYADYDQSYSDYDESYSESDDDSVTNLIELMQRLTINE